LASCDRGQDLDAGVSGNCRVLAAVLAVDEHVDVPSDQAALVGDPAAKRGALALELAQFERRCGLELVLPSAAGQLTQRVTDADESHGLILRESERRRGTVDPKATFSRRTNLRSAHKAAIARPPAHQSTSQPRPADSALRGPRRLSSRSGWRRCDC